MAGNKTKQYLVLKKTNKQSLSVRKVLIDENMKNLSQRMYMLMSKHIGKNNAISRRNLF